MLYLEVKCQRPLTLGEHIDSIIVQDFSRLPKKTMPAFSSDQCKFLNFHLPNYVYIITTYIIFIAIQRMTSSQMKTYMYQSNHDIKGNIEVKKNTSPILSEDSRSSLHSQQFVFQCI